MYRRSVKLRFALQIALLLAVCSGSVATTEPLVAEQQPDGSSVPDVDAQSRRVLAIYSEPSGHPVNVAFDRQFQSVLKRQHDIIVEHYAEYFESPRFPGEAQARIMREYLQHKYAERKIDVVFAWGSLTLEFLLRNRNELFPGTPIVYYTSTLKTVAHLPTAGLTGVLNPDGYEKTLALALSLHPDATEAFIISATPSRDKMIEREASLQLEQFKSRVELRYLTDLPIDQLLATVKSLPKRSIILYSRQAQEGAGRALMQTDYLDMISRSASVPVYGPWRSLVGFGSVGGFVDDPDGGATKAAEIVLRVARGARPEDVPNEFTPKVPTFDARQLSRWGIDAGRLPSGSVVLFREPTLWNQYRAYVIAAGVVLGVQSLLIGGLVVQRVRRRRVENALRESEERFRLMADTAPVMIWRANVDKQFDFFNLTWLTFRGRSVEQEAASGWTNGVHPEDLKDVLGTYTSAFDERRAFQMEYRLQRADDEYRWVINSGVPRFAPDGAFAGYIGSCFDITERKQAEAALQESERRYALATTAGSVGVWDWNLETNEIYVDRALKRTLGFADDDIEHHFDAWSKHTHADDADRLRQDAQAHIHGGTQFFENERRMVHRDGSTRWFLTRGSAVRQPDGRVTRIIGTDTDITERKQVEASLEDARREFARIARVTTLAQFAASIAHEVSQPLSAILMNSKACLTWLGSGASTTELRDALLDIVEAATRANEVVTRDRDLFRHHATTKQALDIKCIVNDVAMLVRTRLEQRHVALTMALDDTLPPVSVDRVELQQVLLNLFVNSIEAMENVAPRSRRLTIETRRTGEHLVQVTVQDTGSGMRDVDLSRLFAPFYTTKAHGTGVGLSLSRAIVEAHGGQLWAEPDNGRGATFRFTLPVAEPATEDAGAPEALDVRKSVRVSRPSPREASSN
jgi:two-component system sensor kinase FixL